MRALAPPPLSMRVEFAIPDAETQSARANAWLQWMQDTFRPLTALSHAFSAIVSITDQNDRTVISIHVVRERDGIELHHFVFSSRHVPAASEPVGGVIARVVLPALERYAAQIPIAQ